MKPTNAKQVKSHPRTSEKEMEGANLLDLLYSSSDEEAGANVLQIRINDQGRRPQCARVLIQGVPVYGIVDSGADISIIGGGLFRRVAAAAKLRKRDLKKPDKTPRTYDHQPFSLDGRMDLDISFGEKTMCTPIYIKMDAHEQLLLSEGVCRQLGIVTYHPDVQTWRGGRKQSQSPRAKTQQDKQVTVPTVRVSLVQSVRLSSCRGASRALPRQGTNVAGARPQDRGSTVHPDTRWTATAIARGMSSTGHLQHFWIHASGRVRCYSW